MLKRDELSTPNSCMSRAKDDEMTFVLLGRDAAAPAAIAAWIIERIRLGKNTSDDPQILEAKACLAKMAAPLSATAQPPAPEEFWREVQFNGPWTADEAGTISEASLFAFAQAYKDRCVASPSSEVTSQPEPETWSRERIISKLNYILNVPGYDLVTERVEEWHKELRSDSPSLAEEAAPQKCPDVCPRCGIDEPQFFRELCAQKLTRHPWHDAKPAESKKEK